MTDVDAPKGGRSGSSAVPRQGDDANTARGARWQRWAAIAAAVGTLLGGGAAAATYLTRDDPDTTKTVELGAMTSFVELGDGLEKVAKSRLGPGPRGKNHSYTPVRAEALITGVTVDVPATWNDIDTTNGWVDGNGRVIGPAVFAASNVDEFLEGVGEPGLFVGASSTRLDPDVVLAGRTGQRKAWCSEAARGEFNGGALTGQYIIWSGCGEENTLALDMAGIQGCGISVLIYLRLADEGNISDAKRVLRTIEVNSSSPSVLCPPSHKLPR